MKKRIAALVDWSGDHPIFVLIATLLVIASSWTYASHLELRSDFLELLPRDSPGFQAFEHQLGRVGGGASLLVVVQSPDRSANEKFIDDISAKLGNGAGGGCLIDDVFLGIFKLGVRCVVEVFDVVSG